MQLFGLPESELVIRVFPCSMETREEILVGELYLSQHYFCFKTNSGKISEPIRISQIISLTEETESVEIQLDHSSRKVRYVKIASVSPRQLSRDFKVLLKQVASCGTFTRIRTMKVIGTIVVLNIKYFTRFFLTMNGTCFDPSAQLSAIPLVV